MQIEDALKNRLSMTSFGHLPSQSSWRTQAMRSHATPRLIFFAKGQGRITIAGLTSGYGPNNLIFVPANTMYGFEVGPASFGQILTIPDAMAVEWPDDCVHLRLRDVHAQKDLAHIFDALERELLSAQSAHGRAAHYHLGLLSVYFERQIELLHTDAVAGQSTQNRMDTAPARLVAAYTDLVERDFRSRKGVSDFAAELGVTSTHLTRCCKITCGRSALALLNDRVLYEARVQLRETDDRIQDIAEGLGFTSAAYFTRAFHTHTGCTPTHFRQRGPAPVQ